MPSKDTYFKSGESHPNWKGGRSEDEMGYIRIVTGPNERKKEHVVIMENIIGRSMCSNECVHHKNEIKNDNRIENLQLMTKSDHGKLHNKDRRPEENSTWKNHITEESIVDALGKFKKKKDVAEYLGISKECLYMREKYYGIHENRVKKELSEIDIITALRRFKNIVETGKSLGVSKSTINNRIKEFGIDYKSIKMGC